MSSAALLTHCWVQTFPEQDRANNFSYNWLPNPLGEDFSPLNRPRNVRNFDILSPALERYVDVPSPFPKTNLRS